MEGKAQMTVGELRDYIETIEDNVEVIFDEGAVLLDVESVTVQEVTNAEGVTFEVLMLNGE